MLRRRPIALQEALRKHQQINPAGPLREFVDQLARRLHIAHDLRRLAHPDPHGACPLHDGSEPHPARVEIDSGIRILAQTVTPPTVRSLDAIHLATGPRLRDQQRLTSFVTYDKRLAETAPAAGLAVGMPTG
ncbi:hypothetical protein Abr02nite_33650 [Paractinoplanes brasiliensis]|nr:hypothetical protein Abr02nite_33650 [Actinoplanes brasiliensis]